MPDLEFLGSDLWAYLEFLGVRIPGAAFGIPGIGFVGIFGIPGCEISTAWGVRFGIPRV